MLDSVMWRMILIENLSTSSSIFQLRSLKKGHIDFHNGFSLKKKCQATDHKSAQQFHRIT